MSSTSTIVSSLIVASAATVGAYFMNALFATPAKPQVVFILGGPGSGKGTQCANIVRDYGFVHLSAGDLLREERANKNSTNGALIQSYIDSGKIVPVDITIGLIKSRMQQNCSKGRYRFLVDGFPRNLDNLQGWDRVMSAYADVRFCVVLDCEEEVCKQRCLGRNEGRSDDNIDTIVKRLVTYTNETKPIIEAFRQMSLLRLIDSRPPAADVYAKLKEEFAEFE